MHGQNAAKNANYAGDMALPRTAEAIRESVMDVILERLHGVNTRLADILHHQHGMIDRAFGSVPETTGEKKAPRPPAVNMISKLDEALDFLELQAVRCYDNQSQINKLA